MKPESKKPQSTRRLSRTALIGREIRQARTARHLTQEALARRIGKSVPTVSKIEAGKQALDVDLLWSIAQALDVSPAALLLKVQREETGADPVQAKVLDVLTSLAETIEGPGSTKVTW